MTSNLMSLISGKWLVSDAYYQMLLPFLSNILEGKKPVENSKPNEVAFFLTANSIVAASNFDQQENGEQYVARLDIKTPIFKYDQPCGPRGTKTISSFVKSLKADPKCTGIVLDIDSGGGQVSGTRELYDDLVGFDKPKIGFTDGVAGSAAYYIISACDYIFANKRADAIGSLGTMMYTIDTTGILEKKGAKVIDVYATKSTEKNLAYRELKKGNEAPIKAVLDQLNETFHKDVLATRPGVDPLVFKGGDFQAEKALELGLIDQIGTMEDAVLKVKELSQEKTTKKITNNKNMSKTISVPSLQNALGYTNPFGSNDNGVYLQESELVKLDESFAEKDQKITQATKELTDLKASVSQVAKTIDAALDNAEIKYEKTASIQEKITLLNDQRNLFASKAAEGKTPIVPNQEQEEEINDAFMSYAHNIEAQKFLED